MEKTGIEKMPTWKLYHVGAVVKDMDKAIERYQKLGIGPFESEKGATIVEKSMWGKPVALDSFELDARMANLGPVYLELIQPTRGDSLWKELLETKGEGINHLCFFVDDLDKEEAWLVKEGYTVMYRSRYVKGGGCAYFDTSETGGWILELFQPPPE